MRVLDEHILRLLLKRVSFCLIRMKQSSENKSIKNIELEGWGAEDPFQILVGSSVCIYLQWSIEGGSKGWSACLMAGDELWNSYEGCRYIYYTLLYQLY